MFLGKNMNKLNAITIISIKQNSYHCHKREENILHSIQAMISRKTQKIGNKAPSPIASLLCLVITDDFPLHLQLNTRITLWGEDFIY